MEQCAVRTADSSELKDVIQASAQQCLVGVAANQPRQLRPGSRARCRKKWASGDRLKPQDLAEAPNSYYGATPPAARASPFSSLLLLLLPPVAVQPSISPRRSPPRHVDVTTVLRSLINALRSRT